METLDLIKKIFSTKLPFPFHQLSLQEERILKKELRKTVGSINRVLERKKDQL